MILTTQHKMHIITEVNNELVSCERLRVKPTKAQLIQIGGGYIRNMIYHASLTYAMKEETILQKRLDKVIWRG